MERWLIGLIISVVSFIIGFFIEPIRDFYEETWEMIGDTITYIFSFEWIGDIGEIFSGAWESLSSIEDSPLINPWFWAFYICLMAGIWYLPLSFGLADYTFAEKLMYTIIFFIVDWIIVSHIASN